MEDIIKKQIKGDYKLKDFGYDEDAVDVCNYMKKFLLKNGLYSLRYYPFEKNKEILKKYVNDYFIGKTARESSSKIC
ncbi:MAG: hypothetical protein Q4C64_07320 [Erysipelotrichia bacterium]|nr:hypothetical protein [Erysipelotrichia bacterium]